MTPDLTFLVYSAILAFVQVAIAATGCSLQVGLATLAGNREEAPSQFEGWVGRAVRAHQNMLESLVLFAIVVLVAQIAGKANEMTAIGAQLFFYSRLAYAVIYIIGVPWLRTLVWALSIVGLALITLQLL
ncbi:MAG: MAPEG family protein [Hyphomicrobiaceae bacterium]